LVQEQRPHVHTENERIQLLQAKRRRCRQRRGKILLTMANGKTQDALGIIAILEIIHEDIQTYRTKAEKDEKKDHQAFNHFKTNTEEEIRSSTKQSA